MIVRARILVPERQIVAALLAGGPVVVPAGELVDEDLRAVAIAELALRPWRTLASVSVEQLVDDLGGDARDVEQLRREGTTRRAA